MQIAFIKDKKTFKSKIILINYLISANIQKYYGERTIIE
jgi:hypothetical protein